MFHGLASAVHDLDLTRTAFGGHQFDTAILDGLEELRAHGHSDVVLFLLEAIATGDTTATGIGVDSSYTGEHAQDVETGKADALSAQVARSMVDNIKGSLDGGRVEF